jgi:CubicO group peptidase (beta-lactamase class C family)
LHLDNFAERELLFEPGTRYRPSSYGWILVSAAVEAAANAPFFVFMRRQVFEPLGMRDTTIDVATEDGSADRRSCWRKSRRSTPCPLSSPRRTGSGATR